MEQKKNSPKGIIFLFTAAVVWGFAFVAQRLGADHVGAFTFNGARFLLGALSLIPIIFFAEKRSSDPSEDKKKYKKSILAGCAAGVFLFAASYLQQLGIALTDSAGKSGFITGLYMIIVPIIGKFMKKKTGITTWIGAVLGVAGLFLICMTGGGLTFTRGDVLLVLCAVLFAGHIIIIDCFGNKIYSLRFAMTQYIVCTILNFALAFILEDISISGIRDAALPIAYCGFMSVGVAYTCQIIGQKYTEPTSASIILSTESVFSAIGGAIILSERMLPQAYLGCVLIMCGIILSQVRFKNQN